ncbi:heavy metal sensor histidine kinase [Halomonas alkalisoli]|uniref:heavy metal sensor histidine kinase n=1 Tax=Halomonas alkalisoli TaxID=2907158 RepID=UPI001F363E6B|nr:heavy metal sensor histidine kinase [Halomonas alkalisoli]MCE9681705.1 heavy metal sensor histidine kinase [Halomonas alkalisoli]
MRQQPLSLTIRLALCFALLAAGLLLVLGLVLGRLVSTHFDEIDSQELGAKMAMIDNLLGQAHTSAAFDALLMQLDAILTSHDTLALSIRDENDQVLYDFQAERLAPVKQGDVATPQPRWQHEGRIFIGREAQKVLPLPKPLYLNVLIGLDISHHAHFLSVIRRHLWTGIAMATLIAALLGWLAVHNGLSPLRRVTRTAGQLSADRLGERLSERDAPPEMLALVSAFNGMLDRLEADFKRLRDFSADIAHELRTPVSNLLTETQVALSRPRSAEAYREVLHSNLEEFERLARMIADMLFLAKADHGLLPNPAETVMLEQEAGALLEFYEALAEEKGVDLQLTGHAKVTGDRLMLRRALSNLVSNAVRHTPAGGTIEITITPTQNMAQLTVSNPGETIPADQLPRLFERFHRADNIRSHHGEGAGLGLAITRSIAKAHGGDITVISQDGFTYFTLALPLIGRP